MKKIALIIFMVIIVTNLYGCKDKNSTTLYENDKYNFTFKIPEDWENKFDVIEKNNSVSFLYTEHKNVNDEYEPFFTIIIEDRSEYDKKSEQEYSQNMVLGQNDKYVFIHHVLLDVGFSDSNKGNDYAELSLSRNEIKERLDIKD